MPYPCRDCRKHFSVKTISVMRGSKLGYETCAISISLVATNLKGISSMQLHRELGIAQKSAWHMLHRIREAFADNADKFYSAVEVDETYIGGKEGNEHASRSASERRAWLVWYIIPH